MKKILSILVICFLCVSLTTPAFAKKLIKENKFDSIIKSNNIGNTATIAISIKNAKTGKVIYETDQDKLLHPASTLKLFSTTAAIDALGTDYCFRTQLFLDSQNNVYIKLGADPLLTSSDLKYLIRNLKNQNHKVVNNVYIDDSIIDNVEWGTGWMWDDDTNPNMAKFSAYNIDENIIKINLTKDPQTNSTKAQLLSLYPVAILNKTTGSASTTNVCVNRYNWQTPDIIELTGTVNTPTIATVPINSMRRYFTYKLDEYLTTDGIKYINENFTSKAVPKDAKMIGEVSHSLNSTIPMILKTSNNRISETVCKLAAAKSQQSTGTNEKTVKLINDFYCKNNVSTEMIAIADASGVSRNNLVSVDWMTNSLNKIYSLPSFDYIKNNMARPGEGTLNNRLFELRGNAWLKTGTISGVSGITGYIMATNGDLYSVAILVQNFKVQQSQVKQLEDNILKTVSEL